MKPCSTAEAERIETYTKERRGRRIFDLADTPRGRDPDMQAVINLLVDIRPCSHIGQQRIVPCLAQFTPAQES